MLASCKTSLTQPCFGVLFRMTLWQDLVSKPGGISARSHVNCYNYEDAKVH